MTGTIMRAQGEGERLWFYGGGVFTVKATADETVGSFFMFEDNMVQGKVTPLHLHPEEEESLYVLEGELLVHFDGEDHPLASGGLFVTPRGFPHALMVT
ncbi:MAG: cupin domain-containing protein, partial [Actinomycetota bacterium]|nr:cupin domain-containing protein [Actinomycetota bacterium]